MRAGLAVPNSRLDRFFDDVDTDNDGVIQFGEWRYVQCLTRLGLSDFADQSLPQGFSPIHARQLAKPKGSHVVLLVSNESDCRGRRISQ